MIYAFLPDFRTPPFCICVMRGGSTVSLSDGAIFFICFAFHLCLFVFYLRFWLLQFRNQLEITYIPIPSIKKFTGYTDQIFIF